MKKRLLIVIMMFTAILSAACSGPAENKADLSAVQDKLNVLDVYKENIASTQSKGIEFEADAGIFRNYRFGMSKEMISSLETLTLSKQFTDALDYTGSGMYGYDMLLTYWFNDDDQLESVSYSMQNAEFNKTLTTLMDGLRNELGEPTVQGYYSSTDVPVAFDTDDQAMQAVDTDGSYYYAAFTSPSSIKTELYANKKDAGYDFWVYFTDYSYYKK